MIANGSKHLICSTQFKDYANWLATIIDESAIFWIKTSKQTNKRKCADSIDPSRMKMRDIYWQPDWFIGREFFQFRLSSKDVGMNHDSVADIQGHPTDSGWFKCTSHISIR